MFMGFNIKALSNDPKLMKEFNSLIYLDNPFVIIYRILKFDITVWKTKYMGVNRILSCVYGISYYSIIVGTLLWLLGLI